MKISVITVSFNSAATIGDTLDSVASQTHQDIEHLIVDGASRDATISLVETHPNPRIRLLSEPDKGIYDAMNKGLSAATGDVIGFLNSDDYYANPQVLALITKAFEDPSVEACHGDLVYVTQDKSKVVRYWASRPFEKGDFARGWCPAHPTFYVRRSVIERLGNFDRSYRIASDVEFMMRYLERGGVGSKHLPHVLVHMRVGGVTNQSWCNVVRQNREILGGLRKNRIPYSFWTFWSFKLVSRARQFLGRRQHSI